LRCLQLFASADKFAPRMADFIGNIFLFDVSESKLLLQIR
jgi:hypothetical protein